MISIEQLWTLIDECVEPRQEQELNLAAALGCVSAKPIVSPTDCPAFDHSAMDGFAFAETAPGPCRVIRENPAGCADPGRIRPGEAARIFTGASLPVGTVSVARQEDCLHGGDAVRLKDGLSLAQGDNIRRAGDIFRSGSVVLPAGTKVTPGAVGLLAACGVRELNVRALPRILHLSTGSELVEVGHPLTQGKIYDSNGPMIEALLASRNLPVIRKFIPDSADDLTRSVQGFSGDLLLISGGSGPGDHDHTSAALCGAGYTIRASRINSRPGKPLIFATNGRQVAFGLPGNPLSHWVCFQAFVVRALARLAGGLPPELIPVACPTPLAAAGDGRRTWTPARCLYQGGQILVEPLEWKHSGDLTPLVSADALLLGEPDPDNHMVRALLL